MGDIEFCDCENAMRERADTDSVSEYVDSQTTYIKILDEKKASTLHSCLCRCSRIKQPPKCCITACQSIYRTQGTQNKRLAKRSVQAASKASFLEADPGIPSQGTICQDLRNASKVAAKRKMPRWSLQSADPSAQTRTSWSFAGVPSMCKVESFVPSGLPATLSRY